MHVHKVYVELCGEDLLHLFGLTLAKQAVVHEYAGQLLSNCSCAQCGHHAGVNAARKCQDHAVTANLRAYRIDHALHDALHGPVGLKSADIEQEVPKHPCAMLGVPDLRMKLRRKEPATGVLHGGDRTAIGRGSDHEAIGDIAHRIAMTHPHGLFGRCVT